MRLKRLHALKIYTLKMQTFVLTYPPREQAHVFHKQIYEQIANYAKCTDIMHTLFYGPACSGKLHTARAFISLHTSVNVQNIKRVAHEYKTKEKHFPFFKSSVHFEIDVNDFGTNNQSHLMELIQELSRTLNVSRNTYKIILLRHAEALTRSTQHQLRRMMELFYTTTRLIMISSSLDRIDVTIQSRLVCIRMPMLGSAETQPEVCLKMDQWLKTTVADMNCIDVSTECTQQLWRVLNKKSKLGTTALRKWVKVIQFTQLPHTDILLLLYSKVCAKFSKDRALHKHLLSVINYYLHTQNVGYRKDFQLEMILFIMYFSIHHREMFDAYVERCGTEAH